MLLTPDNALCMVKREDAKNNNQWKEYVAFPNSSVEEDRVFWVRIPIKKTEDTTPEEFFSDPFKKDDTTVPFLILCSSKWDRHFNGEYYLIFAQSHDRDANEGRKLLETIFPSITRQEINNEVVYVATNERHQGLI